MSKRLIDLLLSGFGLLITSPVILPVTFLVWQEDRHSPFYIAPRVGRGGVTFSMLKMRSMVIHADRQGSSSTSNTDRRITSIGHFIRRYKIDELTQLWNVLIGDMSLVGPRPQVKDAVKCYTARELDLLKVRPGITDFASIVFADEGLILAAHPDHDQAYEQLIRPGKSKLGLFYVQHRSLWLDLQLIFLTLLALVSRKFALISLQSILTKLGADSALIELAGRCKPLRPGLPPGSAELLC